MTRLAVVVPCYNERARLDASPWLAFLRRPDPAEVVFYFANDGSTDDTRRLLEDLCARTERARLIDYRTRRGKGEVVRRAILEALAADGPAFDYVGFWDADLATPLDEIPRILRLVEDLAPDGVLCSRVKRLGARIERRLWRHFIGRVFATAASLSLDLPVYDTQCGAKVFKAERLAEVMAEPFVSAWMFDIEIIFRLKQRGLMRLVEMPVSEWVDQPGSKLRLLDFLRAPFELFRIHRRYR